MAESTHRQSTAREVMWEPRSAIDALHKIAAGGFTGRRSTTSHHRCRYFDE
jgi:hypothetical protein